MSAPRARGPGEIVAALAEEGYSQRQIADAVGVGHDTVRRDVAGASAPPDEEEQAQDDAWNGANAPPTTADVEP